MAITAVSQVTPQLSSMTTVQTLVNGMFTASLSVPLAAIGCAPLDSSSS